MPFAAAAPGAAGLTAGQALAGNIAVGSIIGGTVLQVGAERSAAKTAAAIADRNAANLRVQAEQETEVAAEEQKRLGEEKKRKLSRLRVLAANAGIDIEGTPLLQIEEVAGEFEEERRFIGQAGRQRRFGLISRAEQEQFRGKTIRRASRFRTGTTLLTGASQLTSLSASLLRPSRRSRLEF